MEKFSKIIDDTQKYIGDRFSDFQKPPLVWMMIFDFKVWPKSFSGANSSYGFTEIESLAEFYRQHRFFTDNEAENMPEEWTTLRTRINSIRTQDVIDVYRDLLKEMDADIKNILVLVELMATISPSTAACERGFSTMKREKTNLRTSLADERLEDIVRICVNGGPLEDFDPSYALDHWLNSAKNRHLKGHMLTGPRGPQKKTLAREVNETELEMQMLEEFMPLEE